ncbi:MAG: hypothetical protein M1827_003654 [Pycnora praestabilis]|nr:MAG: hypothetical protein M1827_003654 [Pycnora praestabilis]
MAAIILLLVAALFLAQQVTTVSTPTIEARSSYWSGFKSVRFMFVFGDSYSTTDFNLTGSLPGPSNPLGNPGYPGWTASNGPNWVDFLTTTYNQSFIETFDLAYGGATVDSALVKPYLPTVLSLKQQIQNEFLPTFTVGMPAAAPWTSADSLFSIFIGINDVGNTYAGNYNSINNALLKVYSELVDQLYQNGARNFVFLNVPPIDRSPGTTMWGVGASNLVAADISLLNNGIVQLANNLTNAYHDSKVFQFNTNAIFSQALDNPATFPQTAEYKNTTEYCIAYENGTPSWYTLDESCRIPVNEYFWLNTLHPTFPMHNATAAQLAELLVQ